MFCAECGIITGGSVKNVRMRKKPNLQPRMERCASVLETAPEQHRGRWLDDMSRLTGRERPFSELHIELGCGKGRFTAGMAEENPDVLFVAIEKVPDAMVVAMERVCASELDNVRFLDRDAAQLGEFFAEGEARRIYINFPDPWPKKKQFKRRLTAPSFQKLCAAALAPGGEIWFKTDNAPLFEWSVEQLAAGGWELREVTRDLHENGPVGVMTDYEAKFHAQGVKINRLVAVKGENTLCG